MTDTQNWAVAPGHPAELPLVDRRSTLALPVFRVVGHALGHCWSHRRSVAALAAAAWVGLICITLLSWWVLEPLVDSTIGQDLVAAYVALPFYATFGYTLHREILLGQHAGFWWRNLKYSPSLSRFLIWSMALSMIYAPLLLETPVAEWSVWGLILWLLGYLALAYIEARVSIALPMSAVEPSASVREVWELSRGFGFRLLFVVMIAGCAASFIVAPVGLVVEQLETVHPSAEYLVLPVWSALVLVVTAIEIAALSIAFRCIREARAA